MRGIVGEPSFLSGARVFPFATRQSILDWFAHRYSRHLRADHRGHRRILRETSGTYLRHRAACRGGSLPGILGGATPLPQDRLPAETLALLRVKLAKNGTNLVSTPEADRKLAELRGMYEPYVYALANHLSQPLPGWIPAKKHKDNWQTTAWAQTSGTIEMEAANTCARRPFLS